MSEPIVATPVEPRFDRHRYHCTILALASLVLIAAALLHGEGNAPLRLPWLELPLPTTCGFRNTTGLDCPGCGLSRSFVALAHGRPAEAWRLNPAGLALFAVLLGQFPYRLWQIRRLGRGRPEAQPRLLKLLPWLLLGILVTQWIVRSILALS